VRAPRAGRQHRRHSAHNTNGDAGGAWCRHQRSRIHRRTDIAERRLRMRVHRYGVRSCCARFRKIAHHLNLTVAHYDVKYSVLWSDNRRRNSRDSKGCLGHRASPRQLHLILVPLALGRPLSRRAADRSHLPARRASTKEAVAAVGFEPGHVHSRWHIELLQHLTRLRIDSSQVALAFF